MNASSEPKNPESAATAMATAENVIPLTIQPKPRKAAVRQRFEIKPFSNPRTGSQSWRVSGIRRDSSRVRENFSDEATARCRQIELETEYLQGHVETAVQATKLNGDQIRLCEAAVVQLGDDWPRILDAVTYWQQHGKQRMAVESPRIDQAVDEYILWLDSSPFRDATKRHWKTRMKVFKNSVSNVRVADVTPEFIETFLAGRKTSAIGKDTDRRAISRFFSWAIERPRRWAVVNPCREVRVDMGEAAPIQILPVKSCKRLLRAAEKNELAPYVAVCLFGGLRPFEAARLDWAQVNLKDREIRLEASQTKTGQARVISICDTLHCWLKAYKNKSFYPPNWRKKFDAVRKVAKLTEWAADVMRHTAISHFFRKTGSYGQTAEQFGNSEAIIKAHYQGRVSSDDTKKFYGLRPANKTASRTSRSIVSEKSGKK